MNWEAVRAQFPALENWTWLNTATYGQVPLRTRAAVDRHFARRDETACADFLTWFDDMDEIRALIAQLIHCRRRRHRFRDERRVGALAVPRRHGLAAGDRIVTLRDEFPNQYYCAASLADRGVELIEMDEIELAAGAHPRRARQHRELLERLSPRSGVHLPPRPPHGRVALR